MYTSDEPAWRGPATEDPGGLTPLGEEVANGSDDRATQPARRGEEKLRKTALGVPDIVFFIVAASAPLTVIAGGVASTYLVTGNAGVPLLFLVLGAILALFVTGYAAMSHHITNAGAFYAYVSKGIGKVARRRHRLRRADRLQHDAGRDPGPVRRRVQPASWPSTTSLDLAVVHVGASSRSASSAILGWLRVDLNAKVLAIFLTCEILVVLFFDLVVAADPGPQGISADQWDPSIAFGAGVGAALCFTMAAFVGFESAAIYGEECKNPRRTVARATYIALGITSIFYALSAWMLASAVGTDTVISADALVKGGFTTPDGAAPDPTSILFITLERAGVEDDRRHRDPALLHQPVRGVAVVPQRGRALLLRPRQGGRAPEGVRAHATARARRSSARSRRPLIAVVIISIFCAVRQRPGAAAVHLAHEPRGAGGDPAPRPGLVLGRRLLPQDPALGDGVDVDDLAGARRRRC